MRVNPRLVAIMLLWGCDNGQEAPMVPLEPADLIIINAELHGTAGEGASAFSVRNGKFGVIGSDATVRALAGPATEIIDAEGRAVLPGLIDGHTHIEGAFTLAAGVDLTGIADKRDWLQVIERRAAELPPDAWLLGGRWDASLSDDVLPDRKMLDAIVPDRPVALADIDGHSLWVNSRALAIAGITADTPVPQGGGIMLDPDTGTPTGILKEGAMSLVLRHVPPFADRTARLEALRDTLAYMNRLGLTGAHNMASLARYEDYRALLASGGLSLRIRFGMTGTDEDDLAAFAGLKAKAEPIDMQQGPMLAPGYIKLIEDGVLSTHTAALFEPYADRPDITGVPFHDADSLGTQVMAAHNAGFPVAIHAIGDRAVAMALDAIGASGARPPLPDRIEHVELVRDQDIERFKRLGVVASVQPHHAITTFHNYLTTRIGPEREAMAYNWQSLASGGARLVLGSDWPTAPVDPLIQLWAATERLSALGRGDGPWRGEERLAFAEALRAYSQTPADIAGWGDVIGSVDAGKYADFIILDRDLGEMPGPALRQARVVETWLAGRRVSP